MIDGFLGDKVKSTEKRQRQILRPSKQEIVRLILGYINLTITFCRTALLYTTLQDDTLTTLYSTQNYTTRNFSKLHYTGYLAKNYTAQYRILHCITLHKTTLHDITQYYIALHYTLLHRIQTSVKFGICTGRLMIVGKRSLFHTVQYC